MVGLGDIAQEDMLPGIEQTGTSAITAFITSDQTAAVSSLSAHQCRATTDDLSGLSLL